MRAVLAVVCLALVALLPGCIVQSLHPLYTQKELVFEPALIGVWERVVEEDEWEWRETLPLTFEQGEGKTYRMSVGEGEEPATFEVHLVKLGDNMFLDFFPDPPEEWVGAYAGHVVPVHSFWRMWLEGDELRIAWLNIEWLDEQIEQGKVAVKHEREEEATALLLTADTKDLQQFLLEHADDPEAFPVPTPYERGESGTEGTG